MRSFKKRQIINTFKNAYYYLECELMQWLASKDKGYQSIERMFKNGDKKCVQLIGVNVCSRKKMAQ